MLRQTNKPCQFALIVNLELKSCYFAAIQSIPIKLTHRQQSRIVCLEFLVFVVVEGVPLVEFMYLTFTHMPGESYGKRHGFLLLYLCYVFRAVISPCVLFSAFRFYFSLVEC